MPLTKGRSKAALAANISEMVRAGHPLKQAQAAAYHTQHSDEPVGNVGTGAFEHKPSATEAPPAAFGMSTRPTGHTGEAYTYGQKRGTMPKSPKSLEQAKDNEPYTNFDHGDDDDAMKLAQDVLDDADEGKDDGRGVVNVDEHHPMELGDKKKSNEDDDDMYDVLDEGMDPPGGDIATQLENQQAVTAKALTKRELSSSAQPAPSDPAVSARTPAGQSRGSIADVPVSGWK